MTVTFLQKVVYFGEVKMVKIFIAGHGQVDLSNQVTEAIMEIYI